MLMKYDNRTIFFASEPVDFRMSIDGLTSFVQSACKTQLLDGNMYVFYNRNKDKIKCLFWDGNGVVLYYKKLINCKFKLGKMLRQIELITPSDLESLLSGMTMETMTENVLEHHH